MNKFKPCPFCGSETEIMYCDPYCPCKGAVRDVHCTYCFASLCVYSEAEAIQSWNTRPIEEQQAEKIIELRRDKDAEIQRLNEQITDMCNEYDEETDKVEAENQRLKDAVKANLAYLMRRDELNTTHVKANLIIQNEQALAAQPQKEESDG